MRASVILSLAAAALAYKVTSPSETTTWTSSGANTLSWERVNTDNTTFVPVLVNDDRTLLPTNNVVLSTTPVDGTKGSLSVTLPTSGFTAGAGYRINLVAAGEVSSIYAQSDKFNITKSASSASSGASGTSTKTGTTGTGTAAAGQTGTDSTGAPSATPSNAAMTTFVAQSGLAGVFFAAIALLA